MVLKLNEFCLALYPVGDASLGRMETMPLNEPHPVKDASLTGCKRASSLNFLPRATFLWNVFQEYVDIS